MSNVDQSPATDALRPGKRTTEFWFGVGVDAALVLFLFGGFFSGKLSEDGALTLITTIVAFTGYLVTLRTGLKGTAIVKGAVKTQIPTGSLPLGETA